MFVYCLNNPIFYIDTTGYTATPNLWDLARMHRGVQYDIVEERGYAMEVYVRGSLGRGFLDLFNPICGQYYEVKSSGAANSVRTTTQMSKYDVASILDWRFLGYNLSYPITRGLDYSISGSFVYKDWLVTYQLTTPGLIVYDYVQLDDGSESTVYSTVTVPKEDLAIVPAFGFSTLPLGGTPGKGGLAFGNTYNRFS